MTTSTNEKAAAGNDRLPNSDVSSNGKQSEHNALACATQVRDFNWDQREFIVVPHQDAVAVYTNPRGDIVIAQAGFDSDDEDQAVVLTVDHAEKVIARMRHLIAGMVVHRE